MSCKSEIEHVMRWVLLLDLLWEAELRGILVCSVPWSSGNSSNIYSCSEVSSGCPHYLPSNNSSDWGCYFEIQQQT